MANKYVLLLLIPMLLFTACSQEEPITSFKECVDAGNPVLETYPLTCIHKDKEFVQEVSLEDKCENMYAGQWIPIANECEGVNEQACIKMGGEFNACASACRNDPDAEICTKQCILVCSFE